MYFCTGGCRSGKSAYAQKLAETLHPRRLFMGTALLPADGNDPELETRIRRHQAARGAGWKSVEPTRQLWDDPAKFVRDTVTADEGVVLFDCLTLWVSGALARGPRSLADETILERAELLLDTLAAWACGMNCGVVLVSNETGMGLVPETALARRFRDLAGLVNQRAAAKAATAVLVVSGLPLLLKGASLPV